MYQPRGRCAALIIGERACAFPGGYSERGFAAGGSFQSLDVHHRDNTAYRARASEAVYQETGAARSLEGAGLGNPETPFNRRGKEGICSGVTLREFPSGADDIRAPNTNLAG